MSRFGLPFPMPVTLHTDPSLIPEGLPAVPLLVPFLRPLEAGTLLARYAAVAAEHYALAPLDRADYAVFPLDYRFVWKQPGRMEAYRRFNQAAARRGVPTLVFFSHDAEDPAEVTQGWVLRPSMSRSTRRPEEICAPGWAEDLVALHRAGQFTCRPRPEIPSVGFCGCVHGGYGGRYRLSQRWRWAKARWAQRGWGRPLGRMIRRPVIEHLERDPRVRSQVIARQEYYGDIIQARPDLRARMEEEFVANLMDNDYALCIRGAGNYSKRFYEALACGRIPVLVDTDMVLPLEDAIDYRRHCVWVPASDLASLVPRVLAFHEALDAQAFQERQRDCRQLWLEHLSPEGFLTRLPGLLRTPEKP